VTRAARVSPQLTVAANADNLAPPDGVVLSRAEGVVPYGLNLILWEGGPWAEAIVDVPSEAIGVQFWGPAAMGAGRAMFDGRNLAATSCRAAPCPCNTEGTSRSGFGPGRHTIRSEHLDLDGRPDHPFFGVR
jgi:hypothetical protein